MNHRQTTWGFGLLTLGLVQLGFASGPVEMGVLPAISHQVCSWKTPVLIHLKNMGEPCHGFLLVGGPDRMARIPFQLSAKETRSLIAYCPVFPDPREPREKVNPTLLTTIVSQTDTGASDKITLPLGSLGRVLAISKNSNSLLFLTKTVKRVVKAPVSKKRTVRPVKREIVGGPPSSFQIEREDAIPQSKKPEYYIDEGVPVGGLRPSFHVEREDAFQGFETIFLGEGSQAITDAEVVAIKDYLVRGGQVVFGSNPNSAIADPRWNKLVASSGEDRWVGLGKTINLGFDPEEANSKIDLRFRVSRRTEPSNSKVVLPVPAVSEIHAVAEKPGTIDPFRVQLPSFSEVAAILGAYFVVVIPVNYLFLRKLQRVDLMWVTAPILAIGFSSILFHSANRLYIAPNSVRVIGNLICQSEVPRAVFDGNFAIFTPRAGTLDLNLKPTTTDLKGTSDESKDYFRGNSYTQDPVPEVLDSGTINVPRFRSSNLQFRQFRISQILSNPNPIAFKITNNDEGFPCVKATNISKLKLTGVSLIVGASIWADASLEPGESITLAADKLDRLPREMGESIVTDLFNHEQKDPLKMHLDAAATRIRMEGRIAVVANALNFPVGPQLAGTHSYRSIVSLVCFAPNSLKFP